MGVCVRSYLYRVKTRVHCVKWSTKMNHNRCPATISRGCKNQMVLDGPRWSSMVLDGPFFVWKITRKPTLTNTNQQKPTKTNSRAGAIHPLKNNRREVVQYCTVLYSTVQYCTVPNWWAQYSTVQYCTTGFVHLLLVILVINTQLYSASLQYL
jgi:hypothetical protein